VKTHVWSGVGIAPVAARGGIIHDQKLDTAILPGMRLIPAGVVILNAFSKPTTRS
jgi:multidrug transporter EmrE-like cation transporter